MNIKLVFSLLLLITAGKFTANAQAITFDKKSGNFSSSTGTIAVLKDEKNKKDRGKNYIITDAAGQTELFSYTLHSWQDTLGSATRYWYTVYCKQLDLNAYRPIFTGMLNTFKEVGEMVVAKNLLTQDGKINEQAMKDYFASQQKENPNYDQENKAHQDSLIAQITITAEPVTRDKRKDIIANEYGKIGQGNTTIGYWEYKDKVEGFHADDAVFTIRNMNGGIICVSWISMSGAHTYSFKNGVRSNENWTIPDFVHNNPIQNKTNYIAELSKSLVKAGLL